MSSREDALEREVARLEHARDLCVEELGHANERANRLLDRVTAAESERDAARAEADRQHTLYVDAAEDRDRARRERDAARAEAKALREAMTLATAYLWPSPEEGHTGFVDRLGMEFYRETGTWPHFKSAPLEMHTGDPEEARRRWSEWLDTKRNAAAATIESTLRASPGPREETRRPWGSDGERCPACATGIVLPTCDACGESWIGEKAAKALDARGPVAPRAGLREARDVLALGNTVGVMRRSAEAMRTIPPLEAEGRVLASEADTLDRLLRRWRDALASTGTPATADDADRPCPVGCGPCHEDPGPWHDRGCPRWRAMPPPLSARENTGAPDAAEGIAAEIEAKVKAAAEPIFAKARAESYAKGREEGRREMAEEIAAEFRCELGPDYCGDSISPCESCAAARRIRGAR